MMDLFLNQFSPFPCFLQIFSPSVLLVARFSQTPNHAYIPIIYIIYTQPEQPSNYEYIDTYFNF
jgi:hypothetical protein